MSFTGQMTQSIVITSGKGGVGKTNISVNTAIALAQQNFRTCLFDADLGLANVDILLGIHPEYTLDDYIFGDKNLTEVVLETRFGIDVIPGSSGIEKMANLDKEEIAELVTSFSQIQGYDYFLIDTASGISRGVIAFCLASTETIIVITSESTSLTDAYALLKVMALHRYPGTVKILVNKSPSIPQAKETYRRLKEVVNRHLPINIAPAGIILNDPNIETSVTHQEPAIILYPDSIACQCIRALVSNLIKDDTEEHREEDFREFWQRYFDFSFLNPAQHTGKNTSDTKRSLQPVNSAAQNIPPLNQPAKPPIVQPILPPIVPTVDNSNATKTKNSTDPPYKSIVSFAHDGGIFDPANLATPSPILAKALQLKSRGELTEEVLLDLFLGDPVLMTRALQLLSRPDANVLQATRVTKKHQLVEELGVEVLSNLLSTTAIQRAWCSPSSDTAQLAISFWTHSQTCALLAEGLAEMTAYPFPGEAFIAGLIHDIGRLALQTDHPEVYARFPRTFLHEVTVLDMEAQIFKANHAEVGARTLKAWNLDSFLVDAVQYHTEPLSRVETAFSLVKIVFLACRMTQFREDSQDLEKLGQTLLGLSPGQVQGVLIDANQKLQQLANKFDIPINEGKDNYLSEEIEAQFRHQVMEYSILQGVLPKTSSERQMSETMHTIFQAFDVLFHMKPTLCLLPNGDRTFLKAIEYPNCFGWGTLDDIRFLLTWKKSLIVQSFTSGKLKTTMDDESSSVLSLADRQLLNSLGTEGFVCVPMVCDRINRGVIVFGISTTQLSRISSLQDRLEQFGMQAAWNICSLETKRIKSIEPSLLP